MKFKAEPKDVLIFAVFCIFLLLVCSIVVVNAAYIANYGYFYGINPFKGFSFEYPSSIKKSAIVTMLKKNNSARIPTNVTI